VADTAYPTIVPFPVDQAQSVSSDEELRLLLAA
jgi:hypothetical protein